MSYSTLRIAPSYSENLAGNQYQTMNCSSDTMSDSTQYESVASVTGMGDNS